jgi:hypothetical protein
VDPRTFSRFTPQVKRKDQGERGGVAGKPKEETRQISEFPKPDKT